MIPKTRDWNGVSGETTSGLWSFRRRELIHYHMRTSVLVYIFYFILAFAMLSEVMAKKKKGVHVKKVKAKKVKVNKKVKRFFAVRHHHHKKATSATTTSVSTTLIAPTLTTFSTQLFSPTPVLLTITDRDYNYFFGYAATVSGAKYFDSNRYYVAGEKKCGCADSHPIVVTTYPRDEFDFWKFWKSTVFIKRIRVNKHLEWYH